MHHTDNLRVAKDILAERAALYGAPEPCFERISQILSVMLGRRVTRWEVTMFHVATKLARMCEPGGKVHGDNYRDAINYLAFAEQFATDKSNAGDAVMLAQVEAEMRQAPEIAKMFAPRTEAGDAAA